MRSVVFAEAAAYVGVADIGASVSGDVGAACAINKEQEVLAKT